MTETSGEPAPAAGKADGYPCPECGAQTALEPGTDSLVCDHCGAKIPIESAGRAIVEHDFAEAIAGKGHRPADQMAAGAREVQCKVCGARAIITRQADRCAFCDAPMVVELDHAEDTILPESVLPFVIEQKDAGARFNAWLKSRWFAPGDLTRRAKRDGMDGVYLPYWTFDSKTTTRYVGQRGEHYWDTEHYTDSDGESKTRQVRKTRWYPASGTVQVSFDDVLVCATPTLPRKLIEKLEPWDLPELRPFDGKYLAGFIAERYQVELGDGFEVAQDRMDPENPARDPARHRRRRAADHRQGHPPRRRHVQARAAAAVAVELPLQGQGLPGHGQRAHRRDRGRAAVELGQDRAPDRRDPRGHRRDHLSGPAVAAPARRAGPAAPGRASGPGRRAGGPGGGRSARAAGPARIGVGVTRGGRAVVRGLALVVAGALGGAAAGCGHVAPAPALANRSGAMTAEPAITDLAGAADAVGTRVRVEGVARDAKLSAVVVAGDLTVYVLDHARWPADLAGQRVAVRGVLVFTHAHDAQLAPDGAISQGTSGGVYAIETAEILPVAGR